MSTPDISQQAVYQGGNSVFDKVHILDELVYDFTKSGTLSINSVGVCTFTKVNTDQLEAVNSNITGIYTVDGNFYLTGALLDSSGDTGTSGQILASTGSGTNWIAANTTSVANAINVTFQQIQKYEKGTNGVSSSRLMQLANFLKVPITYFYEDFPTYKGETSTELNNPDLNYSFLVKTFSKLSDTDKNKLVQILRNSSSLKETG